MTTRLIAVLGIAVIIAAFSAAAAYTGFVQLLIPPLGLVAAMAVVLTYTARPKG